MLDPDSRMPLYHQVEDHLRTALRQGTWKPGEAIPPERVLIERYGVSRITIRQALDHLVAEGWLVRRHGRGTFVATREDRPLTESLETLTGHLEELQMRGLAPQVEVLALERRPLPPDGARDLARPAGSPAWHLHRLVRLEGEPLMLSTVWLPGDLGLDLDEAWVKREGMLPMLTRHGLRPLSGRQRIGAAQAGLEEAQLLGIREGEAVLRVHRVLREAGGRPLVVLRSLYRADRYEYEIELRRKGVQP